MTAPRQLERNADRKTVEALRAEIEALRAELARLTAAEHELISLEARMQFLLEHTGDAVIEFERDGTISAYNRAAERIFGYPEVDMLLQHGNRLFDPPERFRDNVPGYLLEYLHSTPDQDASPLVGRRQDGTAVQLQLSMTEIDADDLLLFNDLSDVEWRPRSSYEPFLCVLREIDGGAQGEGGRAGGGPTASRRRSSRG